MRVWLVVIFLIALPGWAAVQKTAIKAKTTTKISRPEPSSSSSEQKSVFFGHNVTNATHPLKKNTTTMGFLAIAYAPVEGFMIGTSPWIYLGYNMHNWHLRYNYWLNSDSRLGYGLSYFQSYNDEIDTGEDDYQNYRQKSYTGYLTYSRVHSGRYTSNWQATYYYYLLADYPYSLRMNPFNDDKYETALTSLHEFRINKNYFINYELGSLGLNYTYPYLHTGLSVMYQNEVATIKLGGSYTSRFTQLRAPDNKTDENNDLTDAVHPEVEAQLFF